LQRFPHVVYRAEIERALDANDLELRAFARVPLDRAELALRMRGIGAHRANQGLRCAIEIKHHRHHDAQQDRHFEMDHQCRQECGDQYRQFGAAAAGDHREMVEVEQAPGDQKEDRRHRCDRQIGREWRDRDQYDDETSR
jgi:hypothetical protein